jgi:MtN3 and saliva related transmembrane protein
VACFTGSRYAIAALRIMEAVTVVIGLVAGALTTLSFLPQVIKTWRTRSARDISLGMFAAFCVGVLLWICYGIRLRAAPIVIANALTLALAGAILVMKLRFDRKARRSAAAGEEPLRVARQTAVGLEQGEQQADARGLGRPELP